jgi:hypothetical protein
METFLTGRDTEVKTEAVQKVLILRMDPLAMIDNAEGNTDKDAVIHLLEEGVSVRTGAWLNGAGRSCGRFSARPVRPLEPE